MSNLGGDESRFTILNAKNSRFYTRGRIIRPDGRCVKMAVFTLETIYPPQTDNPRSKSVKIDGKTDG